MCSYAVRNTQAQHCTVVFVHECACFNTHTNLHQHSCNHSFTSCAYIYVCMRERVCVSSADACMHLHVRNYKFMQILTAGQPQALFKELPGGEDDWPESSHLIQSSLEMARGSGPYVPASHKRHLEPFSSLVEYLPKYVNRNMCVCVSIRVA